VKNKALHLLKKSERYTKTDMVYLVGKSGWLLFGQMVTFISTIITVWVFANFVDPSDYGLYKFVLSIATIASITTLTGFSISIAKNVAQGFDVSLNKILKVQIKYGLLGAIGLLILSYYYVLKDNHILASLFAVAAMWIPFYEPLSNYQYILLGKKEFKLQTLLRIMQRFILSLGLVAVIIFIKNIVIITFAYFLLLTISNLVAYVYTVKAYPGTNDEETPYSNLISFGKNTTLQNIFLVGVGQLDKILLFKFLGPAQLAAYYFATAVPNEIQGVLGNINSVAFPKLVDKNSQEFKTALIKKMVLFSGLLVVVVVGYILTAPLLFTLLFPVYLDHVFISQLFIGTILFTPFSLFWSYFYATENKKALWFNTILGPSAFISGIVVFVPLYGLIGAVISLYIRNILDLVSGLYFFNK
jgi:O-antigen/teichoic acid export membrane protein